MKFILHINVRMPTIVGILTFISRINTMYERFKQVCLFEYRKVFPSKLVFMLVFFFVLFDLILYVPSTQGRVFLD